MKFCNDNVSELSVYGDAKIFYTDKDSNTIEWMPFSVKSLDPGACENYYAIPNESEALNWNNLNYSNGRFKLVFEGHILHSGEIILYKK